MIFLHPEFLYYLLPPMLVLFTFLLTQKESQAHFFSEEVIDKLRVSANTLTLKARNALFLLVGVLVVIALAQPVIKDGSVKIKAKSADIMIALDISDSMLAEDVYPSRLELAKKKALTLLKDAPNERLGVIAFAKNSYLVSPLSFDSSAVAFLLSKLDTGSITQKGTDFLSMLEVAANSKTKTDKKYLLILSDGGDQSDFSKEIEYAKDKNIVVFVLGMGSKKGAPVKLQDGTFIKHNGDIIISKLNENISDLATETGGVYIQNSVSEKDIKTMFKEMQSVSDKKELKSQEIQKYIPLFYFPLGLSLFILLIATSSMSKRVKVDVPNVLLVFLLLGSYADLKAGLLDFMELDKAKQAYNKGDYEESAKIYEKYASEHKNGQSYFNAANSYYKQKEYKKALEYYEKAVFDDKYQRAKNYANMGNAYVNSKLADSLKKAIESYEKSLDIKEDQDVRDNLEAVKKELEKQKQEKQNQEQDQQDKQNNDQKNKDDKNSQNSDNQDSKNNNEEQNESSKSQDSKDKEQEQKDSKSKQEDEQEKNENNDKNESKQQQQNIKNLSEENNESKSEKSSDKQQVSTEIKQMSDAELDKWLEQLQSKQTTYLYQLNKENKRQDENEKPW